MSSDIDMSDASSICSDDTVPRFFKIAIDFGTTCSSVAYLDTQDRPEPHQSRVVYSDEVRLITGFPDSVRNLNDVQDQKRQSVPSQCWYGPQPVIRSTRNRKVTRSIEGIDECDQEVKDFLMDETERTYQWGFGVQDHINNRDPEKESGVYFYNLKLSLDDSPETKEPRALLSTNLEKLKSIRHITKDTEPLIEYLSQLLKHSRQQLEREARFNDDCQVEFVICVPAAWKAKATMQMQMIVEAALRRSRFLKSGHPSANNLFFISEPEAASMCVLEKNRNELKNGQTFIIIDAGGGTVDATCYTVKGKNPLRLDREETMAEGVLCGSSYLNLALHNMLHDELKESDFKSPNVNLDKIIEHAVFEFEYGLKRRIDVYRDKVAIIHLPDLKADQSRNRIEGRLCIKMDEWQNMFYGCLNGISELMFRQIEAARAKKLQLKRVVMVGGFADSPSVQSHVKNALSRYNRENGTRIKLVPSYTSSTAVAQGAVLRALRKDQCPARVVQFSYGFRTDEDYAPAHHKEEIRRAHARLKPKTDTADGCQTIKDTILWTIQKGDILEPNFAYRYPAKYFFGGSDKKLVCKIDVFMSDKNQESHYPRTHEKNKKNAQFVISVSTDMTFLRDDNLIQPSRRNNSAAPSGEGVSDIITWEVDLDLVMRVNGRSLRFEAYWPPMADSEAGPLREVHPGQIKKSCEISLAGAFAHGTA